MIVLKQVRKCFVPFCGRVSIVEKSVLLKEWTHFVRRENKLRKLGDIGRGDTPV